MNSFAAVLFLASAAFAVPQYYYNPGQQYYYRPSYGQYGLGNAYNPLSLSAFRYGQNPFRSQAINQIPNIPTVRGTTLETDFGVFPINGQNAMTPQQRAQYLPVMKALLKVMETKTPSAQDVNTLMVLTRDLSAQVPKGQNLLGNFGNFGLEGLESMGLPESGDIIVNVDGEPHIRTQWGAFPLSDTSLMTDAERATFLPAVRAFTSVLQKDNVDPAELSALMEEAKKLRGLIPENLQGLTNSVIPAY